MISDYIALTKPRLLPLLSIASVSSAIVAHGGVPLNTVLVLLVAGALASGGSGAINSYIEMDLDKNTDRTKNRPLPSGRMNPIKALYFGLTLIASSLAISTFLLNIHAAFFILLGAFFYIFVYTIWLKRSHWSNIIIGGFAGSCASLAGWAAIRQTDALAWVIALIIFLWTPSHFWPLAMRLKSDYSSIGIPMLPSIVSHRKASLYILLNTTLLVTSSFLPYFIGAFGVFYMFSAVSLGSLFIFFNMRLLYNENESMVNFKYSIVYLSLLLISMALETWMKSL